MPSFAEVEVIGFDLDNTLYVQSPEVDAVIQGYINEACAEILGVTVQVAATAFDRHYQGGKGLSGGQSIKAMGVNSDRDIVQEALEFADVAAILEPDPKTIELINELTDRYRSVDILTGSQRQQTEAKLAAIGLANAGFGLIITGDMCKKSTGEAYDYWLTQYPGLTPQQFLNVGDRLKVDSQVPAAKGIQTALVNVDYDPNLRIPHFRNIHVFGEYLLDQASQWPDWSRESSS